jgi:hypothetical protein
LPAQAKIRGFGSDGIDFPATDAAIDSTDHQIYPSSPISASSAFPSGQTKFYNPWERTSDAFFINWEASFDGGTTWEHAGYSANPIFVSLATPLSSVTLFYTTVYLALYNDGATTPALAVSNTWDMFAGPANVETWDGFPLYYYKPGSTFALADNAVTVANLLSIRSGECIAWALLLQDAWKVNGVSSGYDTARPLSLHCLFGQ